MRSLARGTIPTLLATVALLAAPALAVPSVTVSSSAGASNLALDGQGSASTHIAKVADLSLATDAAAGFRVAITSGSLTKTDQRTPIAFQTALVDDQTVPTGSDFTVASGSTLLFSTSTAGTVNKDLYIKYTPAAQQDPGLYGASVDVSITDN